MRKIILFAVCLLVFGSLAMAQNSDEEKIKLTKEGILICNNDTLQLQEGKADVYSLMADKMNAEPYYGDNELKFQYLDTCRLTYVFDLSVDEKQLSYPYCELEFECSDLSFKVFVNGIAVQRKHNNSLRFKEDIRNLLVKGDNKIRIEIEPIKPRFDKVKTEEHDILVSEKRAVFRHAAYQFGWDWAPRQLAGEVFMPLMISFSNQPSVVENINIQTSKIEKEKAEMLLSVLTPVDGKEITSAAIEVFDSENKMVLSEKLELDFYYKDGYFSICKFNFSIAKPQLWFPNGMGAQPLYNAKITLFDANGKTIHNEEKRFGIRTISLVREKDKYGESFYFVCNDRKFFAKGANLVPTAMHGEKYESLAKHINLIKEANMNMLRTWGGGFYMDEKSLNACDENGILIWHDYPFACALYPADSAYLEGVRIDAELNTFRIASHPCLALFCGNNEVFEGWENWGWKKEVRDTVVALKNYERLFKDMLPEIVSITAETLDYVHTSPIHGWGKPQSMTEGDSHYWGVWWGDSVFETYTRKVPRFMSEFGFQSPANLETVSGFSPEPYSEDNPMFAIHQKHNRGFELIRNRLEERFETPQTGEDWLEKAALTACDAFKIGIEAQRRAMPYCMGSLLWQLNEPYPAISWSIIDSDWQPKMVYHTVKKAFEPLSVSIDTYSSTDSVYVYFINDTDERVFIDWKVDVRCDDGRTKWQLTNSEKQSFEWGSHKIASFSKSDITDFEPIKDCIWVEAFKRNEGEASMQKSETNHNICNYAFFVYPKHLERADFYNEIRKMWLQ